MERKRITAADRANWPEGHRVCLLCRELKPFSEFGKNRSKYGGVNDWCKVCRKPRSKESYQKWSSGNREKRLLSSAKFRAKKFGVPFSLKLEDIIIPEFCPVLGVRLATEPSRNNHASPSLDRLIPELGYTPSNIRVISFRANWIKQNASLQEIEALYLWLKDEIIESDTIIA